MTVNLVLEKDIWEWIVRKKEESRKRSAFYTWRRGGRSDD